MFVLFFMAVLLSSSGAKPAMPNKTTTEPWDTGYWEGDILPNKDERHHENGRTIALGNVLDKRNTLRDSSKLWNPDDIPYFIDSNLESYDQLIESALHEFESKSCLRFRRLYENNGVRPLSWPDDYIYINGSAGCASAIGRRGGVQLLSLDPRSCMYKGIIMHEIFHALGFLHEHNRPGRDASIKIHWSYVQPEMAPYLREYNDSVDMAIHGEPYDYESLLHGSNYLYTANCSVPTITAKLEPDQVLGQRSRLSPADVRRLNAHYSCDGGVQTTTTTTTTTTEEQTTIPTAAITTSEPVTPVFSSQCNGSNPSFPDPFDCSKFYACASYYMAYHMDCPSGLFYDPLLYVCNWPRNVICGPRPLRRLGLSPF